MAQSSYFGGSFKGNWQVVLVFTWCVSTLSCVNFSYVNFSVCQVFVCQRFPMSTFTMSSCDCVNILMKVFYLFEQFINNSSPKTRIIEKCSLWLCSICKPNVEVAEFIKKIPFFIEEPCGPKLYDLKEILQNTAGYSLGIKIYNGRDKSQRKRNKSGVETYHSL